MIKRRKRRRRPSRLRDAYDVLTFILVISAVLTAAMNVKRSLTPRKEVTHAAVMKRSTVQVFGRS